LGGHGLLRRLYLVRRTLKRLAEEDRRLDELVGDEGAVASHDPSDGVGPVLMCSVWESSAVRPVIDESAKGSKDGIHEAPS